MKIRSITEKMAADYLGVSPRSLQAWRVSGKGPQFIRYSPRCIRYRLEDLDEWLEKRRVRSTSEISEAEKNERDRCLMKTGNGIKKVGKGKFQHQIRDFQNGGTKTVTTGKAAAIRLHCLECLQGDINRHPGL